MEWRFTLTGVEVRASKLGENSPVLQVAFGDWLVFIEGVKRGEADFKPIGETWTSARGAH